jgi:DNA-binding MarR family transcriptional regulator
MQIGLSAGYRSAGVTRHETSTSFWLLQPQPAALSTLPATFPFWMTCKPEKLLNHCQWCERAGICCDLMTRKPADGSAQSDTGPADDGDFAVELERATRGLLALNVVVLEQMERRIGLAPLRALQALQRLGPSLVTELGDDLGLAPSSASRLSDRLTDAGFISRQVAPNNRRATILELTAAGQGVLDELVAQRVEVFRAVAADMTPRARAALLRGAGAFTVAYHAHCEHRSAAGESAGKQ